MLLSEEEGVRWATGNLRDALVRFIRIFVCLSVLEKFDLLRVSFTLCAVPQAKLATITSSTHEDVVVLRYEY